MTLAALAVATLGTGLMYGLYKALGIATKTDAPGSPADRRRPPGHRRPAVELPGPVPGGAAAALAHPAHGLRHRSRPRAGAPARHQSQRRDPDRGLPARPRPDDGGAVLLPRRNSRPSPLPLPSTAGPSSRSSTAISSPALGWGTLAAAVVAGVVGYHAIAVVFRLLRHLTLHRFSYYVWALGAVLLVAGVMSR